MKQSLPLSYRWKLKTAITKYFEVNALLIKKQAYRFDFRSQHSNSSEITHKRPHTAHNRKPVWLNVCGRGAVRAVLPLSWKDNQYFDRLTVDAILFRNQTLPTSRYILYYFKDDNEPYERRSWMWQPVATGGVLFKSIVPPTRNTCTPYLKLRCSKSIGSKRSENCFIKGDSWQK